VVDTVIEAQKSDTNGGASAKWVPMLVHDLQQEIEMASSLGVKMASGFDASEPELQGKNADELIALTKRGLPPAEAIRAATSNAAELMNWQDKVGALEPNHYADVIAVEGDPLKDVSLLQHVRFVMKGGIVVKDEFSGHER
jgi:imidazolonepropionase-like amidohydrolase